MEGAQNQPLIDYDEGIRLCGGNAQLYADMLRLFFSDPSLMRLEDAISRADTQSAFLQAHTLKGLSSQLALLRLYDESAFLCDILRQNGPSVILHAGSCLSVLQSVYRSTLLEISRKFP